MTQDMYKSLIDIEDIKTNRIYHYTSINGLNGILSDCEFWISKSEFLNDSMEMEYTLNLLKTYYANYKKEYKEFFKLIIDRYESLYIDNVGFSQEPIIHILSLSYNPDSLTLWANYSNFDGYCIELNKEELVADFDISDQQKLFLSFISGKVIYSRQKQLKIIKRLLIKCLLIVAKEKDNKSNVERIIRRVLLEIYCYSIFFKDPKFKQEEEYRFAFLIDRQKYYQNVDFVHTNQSFKPFLKAKFTQKSIVKGITIGPKNNQDIAKNGLNIFLLKNNYDGISIKKSLISLRY